MDNRRGAPRFPIVLLAELTELLGQNTTSGRTSDISRTGCYVDSLHPLSAGTKILIKLKRGDEIFEASAQVVYVTQRLGMGVAFDEPLPKGQLEILERLLAVAARETL